MKWLVRMGCFLCFFGWCFFPSTSYASSGVIQFTTSTEQVAKGDDVTVVCQVISSDGFVDTSFSVRYDERYLRFLGGGKKVSGGNGVLQISSVGNSEATNKRTFSLQFKAKKKGTAVVGLKDQAQITDADGNTFSVSSNSVTIKVNKKESADALPVPNTEGVQVTPVPVWGKENRLQKLQVHCLEFSPAFSPDTKEYTVVVDANTEHLYVNYAPVDEKARVLVKQKDELTTGENKVVIRVIAENGEERRYQLKVKKESTEETLKREEEERAEQEKSDNRKDVAFSVEKKNETIYLKNSYSFEVLDPSHLSQVPAGYIQSNITLNGIRVPAFTMEQDLDNNYLLLYLKGPAGNSTFYQYDREEKTLQRYTGTMTERVNQAGVDDSSGIFSMSNTVLIAIIVVLIVLLLSMLILMLKMAMQRKRKT